MMNQSDRAALTNLEATAKEFGATVEIERDSGYVTCRVTAPNGKRWEQDLHEFVGTAHTGWEPDYQDLISRMGDGPEVCDDLECEWCERPKKSEDRTRYLVAFYEIDQGYGGSEEGGWWYDAGRLIRLHQVFANRETAVATMNRANDLLKKIQHYLPRVSDSNYRGGRYRAEIYEDRAPAFYPETRPHYE